MHWISSKSGIDFYNDFFKDLFLKKTLMPGDRVHKDWYLRADRDIFNQKEPFKPLPLLELVKMLLSKMKSCKTYYPEEGFEFFIKSLRNKYTSELREKHLIKLNKAMPVYGLDYEEKMEKAFSEIHKFSNLFFIGRQGGYYFCLSPNAVYQGIKMADYLLQNE